MVERQQDGSWGWQWDREDGRGPCRCSAFALEAGALGGPRTPRKVRLSPDQTLRPVAETRFITPADLPELNSDCSDHQRREINSSEGFLGPLRFVSKNRKALDCQFDFPYLANRRRLGGLRLDQGINLGVTIPDLDFGPFTFHNLGDAFRNGCH